MPIMTGWATTSERATPGCRREADVADRPGQARRGKVMSKPFDTTMRELFELEPAAWLEFLGIPFPDATLVKVVDSNV